MVSLGVVLPLEMSRSHRLSPFSSQRTLRSPAQSPLCSPHTKASRPGRHCTTGRPRRSRWKASARCISTATTTTSPPSNPRCGASHPWMSPMRRSRNAPRTAIPGEPALLKLDHRDILCFQEGQVAVLLKFTRLSLTKKRLLSVLANMQVIKIGYSHMILFGISVLFYKTCRREGWWII